MARCAVVYSTLLTWRTSKPGARRAQPDSSRSPMGSGCFSAQSRIGVTSARLPGRKARALFFHSLRP
eukprot:3438309-Alexandrium_andersonii.AAC.1